MSLHDALEPIIRHWGYAAVVAFVGLECAGIPMPGEVALVSAALFAASTHELDIRWIVLAAAAGGTAGGSLGYAIGRYGGQRLALRIGPKVGLTPKRLKIGRYLFARHGGALVFVGRFVAALRAYAGFLAGVNGMPWGRFLAFYAAGSVAWACLFGFGAFALDREFVRVARPAGIAFAVVAAVAVVSSIVFMKRHEAELEERAERALPGPIEQPP